MTKGGEPPENETGHSRKNKEEILLALERLKHRPNNYKDTKP